MVTALAMCIFTSIVILGPTLQAASWPLALLAMFKPRKIARTRTSSECIVDDDVAPVWGPTAELKCAFAYRRIDSKVTVAWPIAYQLRYRDGWLLLAFLLRAHRAMKNATFATDSASTRPSTLRFSQCRYQIFPMCIVYFQADYLTEKPWG